ncbi:MAG: AAA domain-containing protein [Paludibacteraceae bacterium]|nr:AAA domain-containing protein [Paludibacteraceae bacterium]
MITPYSFIIINGEPKALQIDYFVLGNNGAYDVRFKNNPTFYHYRAKDVVWIKKSIWHDHEQCKVYIDGKEQYGITEIRSFQQGEKNHWRITYKNGYVRDYMHGTINVNESCLADKVARDAFEYLKRIARTNELGKDEEHGGILPSIYEKITFLDSKLSIAPYLNPKKAKVTKRKSADLIFPFGCNASQLKAVTTAFENQISVIQGPPGTGKTQTILNIIANLVMQQKTVLVVSNNNSATKNVLEKLEKNNFGFFAAALGSNENKASFIKNQQTIPDELQNWKCSKESIKKQRDILTSIKKQLEGVFHNQEIAARSKQELKDIELEWEHFKKDNGVDENTFSSNKTITSNSLMSLWLKYQAFAEDEKIVNKNIFSKMLNVIRWKWMNFTRKFVLGVKSELTKEHLQETIVELQVLFYKTRMSELKNKISTAEEKLKDVDASYLTKTLSSISIEMLKDALYNKYINVIRRPLENVAEIKQMGTAFCQQYPVVLSTTFSSRLAVADGVVFDYIIMDEASQVSIETGALALSCAYNAVIVGDNLQLPNVVTNENKSKLSVIFDEFKIERGYNGANYSFLESICNIIPDVEQTLLREHYRCHPKIINFCNQKFYGGNLLIMTSDNGEESVLSAIHTVPGDHCRGLYNQREIDVVGQEVLPNISISDIGIIAPYNAQVTEFNRQLPQVEAATIHKYQGREKDCIIMSVVDDQITEFSDNPNLINVAVSRAKKRFCIVLTGNEQDYHGTISDLVEYIKYNNFSVTQSRIRSIFDYLYSQYTEQRIALLSKSHNISEFDSENLTYKLLTNIVSAYPELNHLVVLCHVPIRGILSDYSILNDEERQYVSHYATHVDFLITNRVTKRPLLAIETDGYSYHNDRTEQHKRDMMKNHILEVYGLPLLRLSTTGSEEGKRVVDALRSVV